MSAVVERNQASDIARSLLQHLSEYPWAFQISDRTFNDCSFNLVSTTIMTYLWQYADYGLVCASYGAVSYKNRVHLCYSNDFRMTIATGTAILPRSPSTTNVPRSQRSGCHFVLLDTASSHFLLRLLKPGEGYNDRRLARQCFLRLTMSSPMFNSSSHHQRCTNFACRCLRAKLAHSFANNRNPPSP